MDKKDLEMSVLNMFLNTKDIRGDFAINLQKKLKQMELVDSSERPDFIFEDNQGGVVGIEHFLVDTLSIGYMAYSRKRENDIKKIVDTFCGRDDIVDIKMEAMDNVAHLTQEDMNRFDNIDYIHFIKRFREIQQDHSSDAYVERLQTLSQSYSLGYIVEITYPDIAPWLITDWNGKQFIQSIKGVPFTNDMIEIIQQFQKTSFVIVCMRGIVNHTIKCYCIDNHHIKNSLQEQHIQKHRCFGTIRNGFYTNCTVRETDTGVDLIVTKERRNSNGAN